MAAQTHGSACQQLTASPQTCYGRRRRYATAVAQLHDPAAGIPSSEPFIRVADLGHLSEFRRTSHSRAAAPPPLVILPAFAASLGPAAAAAVSLSLGPCLFVSVSFRGPAGLRGISGALRRRRTRPRARPADRPSRPTPVVRVAQSLFGSVRVCPSLPVRACPGLSIRVCRPIRSGLGQSGSSSESFHPSHFIRAIYPSHSIRAISHRVVSSAPIPSRRDLTHGRSRPTPACTSTPPPPATARARKNARARAYTRACAGAPARASAARPAKCPIKNQISGQISKISDRGGSAAQGDPLASRSAAGPLRGLFANLCNAPSICLTTFQSLESERKEHIALKMDTESILMMVRTSHTVDAHRC